MQKGDIQLDIQNGFLMVSGERRAPSSMETNAGPHSPVDMSPPPRVETTPEVQVTPATPIYRSPSPTSDSMETDADADRLRVAETTTEEDTTQHQPAQNLEAVSVTRSLYPIQELKYGKFERSIRLPTGIEVSNLAPKSGCICAKADIFTRHTPIPSARQCLMVC
jgi:hypothetical protein